MFKYQLTICNKLQLALDDMGFSHLHIDVQSYGVPVLARKCDRWVCQIPAAKLDNSIAKEDVAPLVELVADWLWDKLHDIRTLIAAQDELHAAMKKPPKQPKFGGRGAIDIWGQNGAGRYYIHYHGHVHKGNWSWGYQGDDLIEFRYTAPARKSLRIPYKQAMKRMPEAAHLIAAKEHCAAWAKIHGLQDKVTRIEKRVMSCKA